ncbi:MAG TPA: nucleotidyltransferase domain-containing protein [Candidatus Nanoarchaeia archaeon]|nr:nucleotidyltransferase domain-containing protein [Candidatus Aenigmarchaeota archaeon]HLD18405.1 nucleotidyltransferase domain-containing protein [Candidatus Nanoarchaeia archaeon]
MPEELYFITPTTLKVLELFFTNPLAEFHEREVMRKARISKGSANKILKQLAKLDFLIREEKGRMVFYRLYIKNAVVKQFKILYNVWNLKNLVNEIKHISKKIILFGSCAEGTDVGESDIDLLVIAEEKRFAKESISNFNRKNRRKISPIVVNSNEFVKLGRDDKPFYDKIDRGLVLWETA